MSVGGAAPRRDRRRLREQQRRRRRTTWGIVAGAAVVLLVAGVAVAAVIINGQGGSVVEASGTPTAVAEPIVFADDEPAAASGAEPCTTVTVLSSLENSEMVSRLVEGYNAQPREIDGSCVTVVATRDKIGRASCRERV